MADLDLTAAVDAAARASWNAVRAHAARHDGDDSVPAWDDLPTMNQHAIREGVLPIVTAAAPLIEAAVREQISERLLDERDKLHLQARMPPATSAYEDAARIVRGEA